MPGCAGRSQTLRESDETMKTPFALKLHPDDPAGGGAGDNPGGGSGGGSAGDGGSGDPSFDDQVAAAVEKATAALEAKNRQLIGQRRNDQKKIDELSGTLESLGGEEGIKKLAEMRERIEKDELGKLLADGNYEEALEKRLSPIKSGYEKQLSARDDKIAELEERERKAYDRLRTRSIKADVLAAYDGEEWARDDLLRLALEQLDYDDEHGTVVKDPEDSEGGFLYSSDGKSPKSIEEWLADVRESRRKWWPESKGADAGGGMRRGGPQVDPLATASTQKEYEEAYRKKYPTGVGY